MKKDEGGSRFDGLFKVARSAAADAAATEPEIDTGDRQLAKNKDPSYQRTTLYLPKPLHRKLKAAAAESDREMSDIMQELIEQWLNLRSDV